MERAVEIRTKSFAESSARLSTKNAWSAYVRRRWPANTVKAVSSEWDLTDGEAKGVVYGQVSQATIDKILDHRRGGFSLGLEILACKTAITLEQFIQSQAQEARHERAVWEAREQQLARLEEELRTRRAGGGGSDRRPDR